MISNSIQEEDLVRSAPSERQSEEALLRALSNAFGLAACLLEMTKLVALKVCGKLKNRVSSSYYLILIYFCFFVSEK